MKVGADADVADVFQLRAQVSNAGEGVDAPVPGGAGRGSRSSSRPSFSLTVPRDRTGALDIALDGLDAGGTAVANGAATIDLHVGDNVTVTITLHAGASLCGNGQIDTGEACDDHDRLSSGDCDYLCQSRTSAPASAAAGVAAAGVAATGAAAAAVAGGVGGDRDGGGGARARSELLTATSTATTRWMWPRWPRRWSTIERGSLVRSAPQRPASRLARVTTRRREAALRQSIQVPANALQVNISGYFRIQSDETGCRATSRALQLDVGGTVTNLVKWSAYNENSDWAFFSTFVNATPMAGQTVTLQIEAKLDSDVNTSFYFDSLSVTADLCP